MSDEQELTDGMHIIVDALKLNNIECIYGVAGIPIPDMARHAQAEGIHYIGFRHEQSAGHAAAIRGYLTKFPGVFLTVSAHGFMNGLPALANATANGFPMIMINDSSCSAKVDLLQGDYEELDQMNAARRYAKDAYRANRPEDLGIALMRAIRVASSGRPGGVYLDLTSGVLAATMNARDAARSLFKAEQTYVKQWTDELSIMSAMVQLEKADRPIIILDDGKTCSQSDEVTRYFIEMSRLCRIKTK